MTAAKKMLALVLLAMFVANVPVYANTPIEKLTRGITNIVTSPMEYVNSFQGLSEKQGFFGSFFGTLIYGTALTVGRIVGGAYEVVTFPIPLPEDYKPIMDPPTPYTTQKNAAGRGSVRD